MPVKNPQEVFLVLLSNARHHTERTADFYREVSQKAENPDVKEALEARALIADKNLETLDQCFEMIEQKPVQLTGRMQEVCVDDFNENLRKSSLQRRGICIFSARPSIWLISASRSTEL